MSRDQYNWEIAAGDFNSPFIRNYIFTKAFTRYPELLNLSSIVIGTASDGIELKYVADMATWRECHKQLKQRITKNFGYIDELIDNTLRLGKEVNEWAKQNITNVNLTRLTDKKLAVLYNNFVDKQSVLYAYGVALPTLDFQEFSFVEGSLNSFLQKNVEEKQRQAFFAAFTYPSNLSFAQEQEENLLKMMKNYNSAGWRKDILKLDLEKLSVKYPQFYQELKKHTKKYAWVYYVYAGPAYNENNFLDFISDYLQKKINPKRRIKELDLERKKIKNLKQNYIKCLDPNKFDLSIIKLASKVVWAKPRRKDLQSQFYYQVEKLQKEISRRLFLSLEQVRSIPPAMLEKSLLEKKIDFDYINSILKYHICLPQQNGSVLILTDKEARVFFNKHVKQAKQRVNYGKIKQINGSIAFVGHAKGTVKIINQIIDIPKMKTGDILVSVATTPAIVPAMKRASAIVTDEGGLTCHAAIVSRELGIPCVVGTKIATKVLRDGDKVEVDAGQGIVRKIN